MNIVADNFQKQDNYREQFSRLRKALTAEFYLEAIFIEYSIIEDRLESILRHANKWEAFIKKQRGHRVTLEAKLNYIKDIAREKKSLAYQYFSDTALDEILKWKETRNRLIHALMKQTLTVEEVSEIAHTGERLTKELRNKATNFNRAIERKIKA